VLREACERAHYCPEVDAHDRQTDIDLQILDLLREGEGPKSAYRLAQELTRRAGEEEALGTHAVRKRLEALASRGLVAGSASAHDAAAAGQAEAPALADPWRITEEGLASIEPEAGVARAPYDRAVVGGEEEGGGRDAGFWVLIAIAVLTAVCAAYSLLVASGVLGGA
jgi:Ribonuclease R winged-helix domain